MRRLMDSAKIYRMDPAYTQAQLEAAVLDTIRANQMQACYIRPLVYRGYNALGVNPFPCPIDVGDPALGMGHLPRRQRARERRRRQGQLVDAHGAGHVPVAREDERQLRQRRSSSRWRPSSTATPKASRSTRYGYVSEGSGQNIFVVRNGILYTPPMAASILPGITRDSVITIAKSLGYRVQEEMIPREMLYIADELFFVGTAVEITPIRSVDRIVDRRRASAARSRRPSRRRSSASSTASCPTRTTG